MEGERYILRHGPVLRLFLLGLAALGIATIAVAVYTVQANEAMVTYVNIFLETLDPQYLVLWHFLLYSPMFAGTAVILFAGAAIYFSTLTVEKAKALDAKLDEALNKEESPCERYCGSTARGLFRASMVVMSILFVLQGVFAGGYLFFLRAMFSSIEQMATSTEPLSDLESDISTLQLAMFNQCCYEKDWSSQGLIPRCTDDVRTPPACSLSPATQRFSQVLCTCYPGSNYDAFYDALQATQICSVLADAVVGISDTDLIPGTELPISAFVPVKRARIVGFNGTVEDDPSKKDPRGYGCGFGGYAKPFQWMQFKYANDASQSIAVAVILISILEIILVIAIVCQLQTGNDEDFFEEMQQQMVASSKTGIVVSTSLRLELDRVEARDAEREVREAARQERVAKEAAAKRQRRFVRALASGRATKADVAIARTSAKHTSHKADSGEGEVRLQVPPSPPI